MKVWLYRVVQGEAYLVDRVTTDSSGEYEFLGVPTGTYRVMQDVDDTGGRDPGDVTVSEDLEIPLRPLLPATFEGWERPEDWSGSYSVSGTVTDSDGSAVEGALVMLATTIGIVLEQAETDANGDFAFSDLATGTYHVVVMPLEITTSEKSTRSRNIRSPRVLDVVEFLQKLEYLYRTGALVTRERGDVRDFLERVHYCAARRSAVEEDLLSGESATLQNWRRALRKCDEELRQEVKLALTARFKPEETELLVDLIVTSGRSS